MIGAGLVAMVRAEMERTMTDVCEVHRIALDQETGAQTDTVLSTGPCRVAPTELTPRDLQLADQVGVRVVWRLLLPALTEAAAEDRIRNLTNGHTYEVVAPLGPQTLELARRVICIEVS